MRGGWTCSPRGHSSPPMAADALWTTLSDSPSSTHQPQHWLMGKPVHSIIHLAASPPDVSVKDTGNPRPPATCHGVLGPDGADPMPLGSPGHPTGTPRKEQSCVGAGAICAGHLYSQRPRLEQKKGIVPTPKEIRWRHTLGEGFPGSSVGKESACNAV